MILKKIVIKDTLKYMLANFVVTALGAVMSIAMKAILGAVASGQWAFMKIIGSYAEYSDLGVRDAMLREMSQAAGAKDQTRSVAAQNVAFTFSMLSAFFSAGLIVVCSALWVQEPVLRIGLYGMAGYVVAIQLYNFFLVILRTVKKINELSLLIVLNMIIVMVFALVGARIGGAIGLVFGFFLATLFSAFLAIRFTGVFVGFQFQKKALLSLVKAGLPMTCLSYLHITFLSLDSIAVSRMLGFEMLGYYTIALMATQQVGSIGRYLHIILFPHVQEKFGRDASLENSARLLIRTTNALACFIPVLIAATLFLSPVLVHYFLPRFIPGLVAMKILLVGYFFVAVNEVSSTVLYTINKHALLVPVYVILCLSSIGLIYLFTWNDKGIEAIAMAMSLSYFVFFLCVFYVCFRHVFGPNRLIKEVGFVVAIFLYFVFSIFLAEKWMSGENVMISAFQKLGIFLLIYSPVLFWFEKKEKILLTSFRLITPHARR